MCSYRSLSSVYDLWSDGTLKIYAAKGESSKLVPMVDSHLLFTFSRQLQLLFIFWIENILQNEQIPSSSIIHYSLYASVFP